MSLDLVPPRAYSAAMKTEMQKLIAGLESAKKRGLLADVAQDAGVCRKTVDRILAGKTDPVYSNVAGLLAALKNVRKKKHDSKSKLGSS